MSTIRKHCYDVQRVELVERNLSQDKREHILNVFQTYSFLRQVMTRGDTLFLLIIPRVSFTLFQGLRGLVKHLISLQDSHTNSWQENLFT